MLTQRSFVASCLALAGAALPAHAAASSSAAELETRSAEVVSRLLAERPGVPWPRWIAHHPGPSTRFLGGSYGGYPVDYWAMRWRRPFAGGALLACSYVLAEDGPPTVERVAWSVAPQDSASARGVDELARRIASRLAERLGPPAKPSDEALFTGPVGARGLVEFTAGADRVRLYRLWAAGPTEEDSLVVERIGARFLAAVRAGLLPDPVTPYPTVVPPDDRALLAALAPDWAGLAAALAADTVRLNDTTQVARALARARAHGTPAEERDRLRWAVHRWLTRLGSLPAWQSGDSGGVPAVRRAVRGEGVSVELTYEGSWCCDEALAESLAVRAGEDRWTDRAFLECMDRGWESPCAACGWDKPFGPDLFRPTIARGEAYLAAHPSSPIARQVALCVAEAHETAWSLAHVAAGDDYVDARRYAADAPEHRRKALALYARVLATAPGTSERALRLRVARLRLDIDTQFHKYWCLWD